MKLKRLELKKQKRHLERLYNFDNDENDDVLKDQITKARLKISELKALLLDAEKQSDIEKKIANAKHIFKNLESTWEHMSQVEKQSVCRELIDRVEVGKGGNISIHLKLSSYLVSNKNNN